MTATLTTADDVSLAAREAPDPTRAVLVATRGDATCASALAMARAIASRAHAPLEAVTVLGPSRPQAAAMLVETRRQWRAYIGRRPARHHLQTGDPAAGIARVARDTHATIVVVGLGRATPRARALGDMTPAHLVGMSLVPMLAACASAAPFPRRVVVDADTPRKTLALLQRALLVAGPETAVTVRRRLDVRVARWTPEAIHEIEAWWQQHAPTVRSFGWHLLRGDDDKRPELDERACLVLPLEGLTPAERSLAGGPALRMLRDARCSVLAVPVDVVRAGSVA
ncbi:MAG TPA: universal stress protein [Gemmatimonadaceae bacterium]|nr:universal stress protein [Gemmatimonadaceae bacterium]